ncbi:kin of IRRE-like protein 3 [Anopheles cruzii]|uniref:kin of IRRE-like protein 3 n=1 Tax=Anopheles cruzii TaxID=68878 RepID=UPI0022EC6793|nr:kin of IRRE-like protein 3 [Anopheles cruzii]
MPKILPLSDPCLSDVRLENGNNSLSGVASGPQEVALRIEKQKQRTESGIRSGGRLDKKRCSVGALFAGESQSKALKLQKFHYPRVEIGPENPLSVERDQTAKLECNIDAKPKPETVKWTRNGRFISSHPTHTIHRVSLQDAGRYTCSADNGLGKVGEQEITLNVLYPPIVQIETKAKTAEEKETVHIKCNVTSNPPPVTIEWLKEGDIDFRRRGHVRVPGH